MRSAVRVRSSALHNRLIYTEYSVQVKPLEMIRGLSIGFTKEGAEAFEVRLVETT